MIVASNVAALEAAYKAFAVGDVPTVLALMDDQIEWIEMAGIAYGGTYTGPQAVVENIFTPLVTEWDGFSVTPHEYIDAGDTVVAVGRYGGTFKATGNALDCDFAHIWEFADGKVIRFRQFVDSEIFQRAMDR
jgi:uncharacterized protein